MIMRTTRRTAKYWPQRTAVLILVSAMSCFSLRAAEPELAPLPLKLPLPTLKGTPEDLPKGANVEPPPEKPRPPFLAPKGTVNVALGKKVTSSDRRPIT